MNDLTQLTWLFPVLLILGVVAVGGLLSFIPVRLWIEAWFSGVRIGMGTLTACASERSVRQVSFVP